MGPVFQEFFGPRRVSIRILSQFSLFFYPAAGISGILFLYRQLVRKEFIQLIQKGGGPMRKAFAITGLVLGAVSAVASATALVFSSIALKADR